MSASGFTPIQLYRSTTAAAVPTAGNLVAGELAINLTDEKLYFENASGVVKVLADSTYIGTVTSVAASGGTTGLTFSGSPITGAGTLTLSGTLAVGNGGTGASTFTANGILLGNGTSAVGVTAVGTTGQVLVGNTGAAPTWTTLSGIGVTSFSAGTTGFTPSTATAGAVTLAGTLGVANGGTGTATTFTAGSVVFAGASGVYTQDNANLFWDNANDRLGIGTASPTSRLTVTGGDAEIRDGNYLTLRPSGNAWDMRLQATGTQLDILSGGALGSPIMSLLNGGNVGIGTSAPSNLLHIARSSGNAIFRVQDTSSTSDTYYISDSNGTSITQTGALPVILKTTNTERMRIDSSGNVGIGTSSPVQRLHVRQDQNGTTAALIQNRNGAGSPVAAVQFISGGFDLSDNRYAMLASDGGSNTTLQFWTGQGATPTEKMRITSGGLVGIGTSAPVTPLVVIQPGSGYASQATFGGTIQIAAGPASLQAGGGLEFLTSTFSNGYGWKMSSIDSSGVHLVFGNRSDSATWTERMRIDSSGNVGIGTTAPGERLTVTQSQNAGTRVAISNQDAGSSATSALRLAASGGFWDILAGSTAANSNALTFGISSTELMRITNAGNVGIGLSNPTDKLEVNGSSVLRGSALFNSSGSAGTNSAAYIRAANALSTATTPDYTWWFNDQCGFFHPAANVIGFTTGGTERARIDSTGNVGIGTATPGASTRLNVAGRGLFTAGSYDPSDGTASGVSISYDTGSNVGIIGAVQTGVAEREMRMRGNTLTFFTNGANERMRIDSLGNVGIGTTGAGYRLDIASGDTTAGLGYAMRLRSNATATAATIQFTTSTVSTQNGIIACSDTGAMTIQTDGASSVLAFRTNGSERLRILNTGGITSGDLADAVGYKGVPQNSQTSAYTLALTDMGKHISITTGGVVIPANGAVAFPVGSSIVIYNNSGTAQNISITTDTLRLAGTATTGTRSLAQRGLATCVKVASTEWVVTGNVS